jgi:hypothetical protein
MAFDASAGFVHCIRCCTEYIDFGIELVVEANVGFAYFDYASIDFLDFNVSQQFFLELMVKLPSKTLVWAFTGPNLAVLAWFEPGFAGMHNWSICLCFLSIN